MDGFTYHSLFDTKGIEYLIIIAFFAILIPFWHVLKNKKTGSIREMALSLSSRIMQIPQGLHFNKNHTWMHLQKNGLAKVGLDDLIAQMAGPVDVEYKVDPNSKVRKGDIIAEIQQDGKKLEIISPLSGQVTRLNQVLENEPDLVMEAPFEEGWFAEIKPTDWFSDTQASMLADQAKDWMQGELRKIREFILDYPVESREGSPLPTLQDGGEIGSNSLSFLPEDAWMEFQQKFMKSHDL